MEADVDNQFTNNGSGGEENVDLRGLGTTRTLVLVDGKRLLPADAAGEVDLSILPPNMVDHIEVYTGGASAVYGSDAIAGVVNVILSKDFEGMELDASYKQTDRWRWRDDRRQRHHGLQLGERQRQRDALADYQNRQPIFQGSRRLRRPCTEFAIPLCTGLRTPATQLRRLLLRRQRVEQRKVSLHSLTAIPISPARRGRNQRFHPMRQRRRRRCPTYNFNPAQLLP